MDSRLANVFFHNWIKAPEDVVLGKGALGMKDELKKLGCKVYLETEPRPGVPVKVAANFLKDMENFEHVLCVAKEILLHDGILFLRMPETGTLLYEVLEVLGKHPRFTIKETYTVGEHRDFLMQPTSKKPTVCIGMIAKNEERDLPRLLRSLEGVADGICLLDTGSTDRTMEIVKEWAEKQTPPDGAHSFYHHVETYLEASEQDEKGDWKLWNFGKARNAYVKAIEKAGFDYVLWMDADDEVLTQDIRNFVYLDQYVMQSFQIESGNLKWPHHRLWKTKKGVWYKGYCHEYPDWGGQQCLNHVDKVRIYHDAAPGVGENSNDRNLRILQREMEEQPSPRVAFYLANTLKDRGQHAEAVPMYQRRMDFGKGYEDEYWFAVLYKGRCQRLAKQFDEARKTLLWAVSEKPDWAEFWMELCYLESELQDYHKSIGYALQAKDRPIVPTQLFREKDKYTDQPYRHLSWGYQFLGDLEAAIRWSEQAKPKIGSVDKDWNDRHQKLIRQLGQEMLARDATTTKGVVSVPKSPSRSVTWHRPGALGDVLMTLNLVQAFKKQNPDVKLYYRAHPSIVKHLRGTMLEAGVDVVLTTDDAPVGRERNLVGYPLTEGYPNKPMSRHLIEYFALEVGLPPVRHQANMRLAPMPIPDDYVTVHPKAGWSMYKEWPMENWQWVVKSLIELGIPVVQIGGPDDPALDGAIQVRETGIFEDSLITLANARVHMGIDSWSNHATHFNWGDKGPVQSVILWGSTQPSAAGYDHNTNLWKGLPCQPCFREDPKISAAPRGICPFPKDQTYENPKHECMKRINKGQVLAEVLELWER